jgi:serine/threonine protein kinase/tetratricopeptide (TPR) repeat protein
MTDRWHEVEETFQTALDLPDEERAKYLERILADDPELGEAVQKLLRHYDAVGDQLEKPILERTGIASFADILEDENDPMIGQRLGAYRIEKEIGRGGMGTVYLASRADNVFQRRVAIKIIKHGLSSDFILQRFRHERQILANLDHPNIARLLDGGATLSGQPYFVMEYIEGLPFYAYCDNNRLNVRQRLELFCHVCNAIEYAHQNHIIHRDIKPSNILVSSRGVPKLFDFGIAKLLNPAPIYETSPQTATSMRLMTLEYASPEQIQGLEVTTLSDIYSLGVLFYEVLTGHRPYRFVNRIPYEMARIISEELPELPSDAIKGTDNLLPIGHADREEITLRHICEMRSETLEGLHRELTGSLDSIALKALEKEPDGRYQSAGDFRRDIESYLAGRTIHHRFFMPQRPAVVTPTLTPPEPTVRSIAVLPLKVLTLSAKPYTNDHFLSIGLADAMIMRLSGVHSLAVRPTSAVLRYGDASDPADAGRELGVDFVLDGRIRIFGDRIRASLQLFDVVKGTTIWADQFDEAFVDALELEDSVSQKVVTALLPRLTTDERQKIKKRGTDRAEAFEAYLRGRFFWNKFTPESLPKALASFQKAVELDPDYAAAHVGMADFYNWASIYGILPPYECYTQAKAAALRALAIDDSFAEAYAALALSIECAEWNWTETERLYLRALELNPNFALAHEWYSSLLVGTGRTDEGLKEIKLAEDLDPLSPRQMTLTAWTMYQVRRFPDSISKALQIIDLDKNYPQGYMQLGINLVQLGRPKEGVTALQQASRLMPDSALPKSELAFALAAAGRNQEAHEVVDEIRQMAAKKYVKSYFIAMAYVAVEEREQAFRWLEKAFAERDPWLVWFGTEPKLDQMRRDPRFIKLFKSTNNPLALEPPSRGLHHAPTVLDDLAS